MNNTIFENLSYVSNSEIPKDILMAADSDPFLDGIVNPSEEKNRVLVLLDGAIIGFFTPRIEKGYYRTGAIYILPQYRGKGYGKQIIVDFFKDKKGLSVISLDNHSSMGIFKAAGFEPRKMIDTEYQLWIKEK